MKLFRATNLPRRPGGPHRDRPSSLSFVPDGFPGLEDAGHGPGVFGFLLLAALVVLLPGCAHIPKLNESERAAIYERANVFFDQTVLIKPEDSNRAEYRLAPMLVQQVVPDRKPGRIPYSVYFWRTFAQSQGRALEQFNYLWFHQDADQEKQPQGVRVTFNREGMPILWEILRDASHAQIFFVSQSLEAAAMTNYPGALPGRRFYVEQAVGDTPNVVVARVLDDSQTAMGPIVYLNADSNDVATLICRCMDAQAKEVVGMGDYGVATLNDAAVRWVSQDKTPNIGRWLPGRPADDLTQWLRLGPE